MIVPTVLANHRKHDLFELFLVGFHMMGKQLIVRRIGDTVEIELGTRQTGQGIRAKQATLVPHEIHLFALT